MLKLSKFSYLRADSRSLSLFRVILGISLLYNIWIKSFYCIEFWGASPIIPQPIFQTLNGINSFSIFDLFRNDFFAYAYFALTGLSALLLTLGVKTRYISVLTCFLFWNLLQASSSFSFGFDFYTFQLLFWSCFLPLDQHFSFRLGKKNVKYKEPSLIFSILLFYQIAWIYLSTAFAKYGESWLEGYAIHNMLNDKWATTELGKLLGDQFWYYMPSTYLSLILEFSLPFLIFFPYKWNFLRLIAASLLFLFHLNIALTYNVGNFSVSGIAVAALLLPEAFWKKLKFKANAAENIIYKGNSLLRKTGLIFSIFATAVITFKNLHFCFHNNFARENPLIKSIADDLDNINFPSPINISFFNQNWKMFAPNPPVKSGWLALEIQQEDGSSIDFFNGKLITEEAKINWTPRGLEFYLLYYCRNYDNPNVNNVKYNLFLKYWIKYILKKHNYPPKDLEKLIFTDYIYITARLPHASKVSYNLYRASEITNQNFENLDSIKSSSID